MSTATGILVLSSGTEGPARPIFLPRDVVEASVAAVSAAVGLRRGDCWWSALPPSSVGGAMVPLRCEHAGASARIDARFDVGLARAALLDPRVTHASLVGRMLERLLSGGGLGGKPPSLRVAMIGGGPVDPALLLRARAAGIPACASYGLSEAASTVTLQRPDEGPAEGDGDCGRPIPGTRIEVEPDGTLRVSGPTVLGGSLRTNDLGRLLPDGRLVVLGRRDDVVVSGGEKVAPAPVEALLDSLPGVLESAVVGVPDPSWGQRLVAAVRWDGLPAPELLRAAARSALRPAQRPRAYLDWEGPLPRSDSGKLRRSAVRSAIAAGVGAASGAGSREGPPGCDRPPAER
jgi:O-succinylbenzoic acid--CoA ligase